MLKQTPGWNRTQSEYRAQLVNGEINVGIVVENVCHPLQADGHMAGKVGGKKVTWHRYATVQNNRMPNLFAIICTKCFAT